MKYKIVQEFELSQEEFDFLKKIERDGWVEYRDPEFVSVDDFKLQGGLDKDVERFMERNADGTYYLILNLLKSRMVENGVDSWHLTYKLSPLGKMLLEQNSSQ